MSIGPLNPLTSAAGTPLAQAKGVEIDVALHVAAVKSRQISSEALSDAAASVAAPDGEDNFAQERSGNGRQAWQLPEATDDASPAQAARPPIPALEPTEPSGLRIDVTV